MNHILAVFSPNHAVSRRVFALMVAVEILVFWAIWETVPSAMIPRPGQVTEAFGRLWMEEGLGHELVTSLLLNLEAICLTAAISLALAYLTVLPVVRPLVVAVSKGRFLGFIGLTFVFTMVFAGGHTLKLAMLVFGMTVFFVTSMADVIVRIPKENYDLARTLRMSTWRVVWEVVVLGTMDQAIEVLRQNAAMGWMMLTMVEGMVRSEGGIGMLLLNQNKHFQLAAVLAIQVTILCVGLAQDYAIGVLKSLLCPYAEMGKESR